MKQDFVDQKSEMQMKATSISISFFLLDQFHLYFIMAKTIRDDMAYLNQTLRMLCLMQHLDVKTREDLISANVMVIAKYRTKRIDSL